MKWSGILVITAVVSTALAATAYFSAERAGAIFSGSCSAAGCESLGMLRDLQSHLGRNPRDARAWVIYARLLSERQRFGDAAEAYGRERCQVGSGSIRRCDPSTPMCSAWRRAAS